MKNSARTRSGERGEKENTVQTESVTAKTLERQDIGGRKKISEKDFLGTDRQLVSQEAC